MDMLLSKIIVVCINIRAYNPFNVQARCTGTELSYLSCLGLWGCGVCFLCFFFVFFLFFGGGGGVNAFYYPRGNLILY